MSRTPVFTRGERMRKARTEAGIDIAHMAKLLGVSEKTIRNWERDAVDQPHKMMQVLNRWAEITDVPMVWILNVNGDSDCFSRFSPKRRHLHETSQVVRSA